MDANAALLLLAMLAPAPAAEMPPAEIFDMQVGEPFAISIPIRPPDISDELCGCIVEE